ncbi:DUF427 domain-containing protein [Paeniglutamicibacter antarcticus]|uniref:DUF427 domain-containing protein n=1 Tax=Arthrobacter terrae TaxID=2935737 RepID=A0A931CVG8_9MICC|nr:DUF427 domain-containing protein [Arthrobacter terrae]
MAHAFLCSAAGCAREFNTVPIKDLAWSYRQPLIDAEEVRDHIAFLDERVDVTIDGIARLRPQTPWS